MRKIILLLAVIAVAVTAFFLLRGGETPAAAYKRLYTAVKAKDLGGIDNELSAATKEFSVFISKKNNAPREKVLENGFTATTFADKLPDIRDERVSGDMGALEVWNEKDKRWEDIPFVLEEGKWKLAVGDAFAGKYKSPGIGQAARDMEAANLANPGGMRQAPGANMEMPSNANGVNPIAPPAANAEKPKIVKPGQAIPSPQASPMPQNK